jgi:hypothetical protein
MLVTIRKIDAGIPILRVLILLSPLGLSGKCFMYKTTLQEENIFACNTVHWSFVKYSHKKFSERVSLIIYLALARYAVR